MTLDEWKNLQEQTRPKPEFNIRKPESTVPSKAVVIHKSKYRDDMVKDDYEDDSHVFRKAANDITSQLEINFGNLPRPGRGARGGPRGGRGRIRRAENCGPRAEVVVGVRTQALGGELKEVTGGGRPGPAQVTASSSKGGSELGHWEAECTPRIGEQLPADRVSLGSAPGWQRAPVLLSWHWP
uniref:Uncharacterized protein n=1 Tax=Oryctolagus cuniculus TaxID=9986 RepID=G1TW81_RABIT